MPSVLLRSTLLASLLLCACASDDAATQTPPEQEDEDLTAVGSYVPILDYWKTAADQDRWLALRRSLDQAFDEICGDTFCGGDYSNLTSLGFDCSVSKKTGRVAECVWTFAGSLESIDPASGKITVSAPSFQCHVATKSFANAVLKGLEADPLHAVVPGAKTSLYDALSPCFANPIGATPVPTPGSGATYVDALDSFTTEEGQTAWLDARRALTQSFDEICGDTFCGGDYSNLASLRFACSANASTGKLGQCAWTFGGSYDEVQASKGAITVHAKSFICPVAATGTALDLAKALTAAGPQDALHRPLPGGTASAYDALLDCL